MTLTFGFWPSFCTSAMSIMGYMLCISLVKAGFNTPQKTTVPVGPVTLQNHCPGINFHCPNNYGYLLSCVCIYCVYVCVWVCVCVTLSVHSIKHEKKNHSHLEIKKFLPNFLPFLNQGCRSRTDGGISRILIKNHVPRLCARGLITYRCSCMRVWFLWER